MNTVVDNGMVSGLRRAQEAAEDRAKHAAFSRDFDESWFTGCVRSGAFDAVAFWNGPRAVSVGEYLGGDLLKAFSAAMNGRDAEAAEMVREHIKSMAVMFARDYAEE